jgi:hypothetical protein
MRSPTAWRQRSRSITTPPARAVTSRACSSSAPIDEGDREREPPRTKVPGDGGRRGGSLKD